MQSIRSLNHILSVEMEQNNLNNGMTQGNGISHSPEPMDLDNGTQAPTNQPTEDNESITSEFEPNDRQEHFELWSSDVTSPDEDVVEASVKSKHHHQWSETVLKENIQNIEFTGESGIIGLDPNRKYTALECFKLFVDDDLIKLMVTETNRNARAKFVRYGYHEEFLSGWLDVDFKEMTQFLGLIIFMAFKRLPETMSYWSTERIYFNTVACRVFTQTRFHRILAFWHFGTDGTDSVYAKVNPVINHLNNNFRKYKVPGSILYIGRSTVHLRNKYIFEAQPVNTAKKGSKILKVMDQDVYTYKLKILSPSTGRNWAQRNSDILELLDGFLDQGRLFNFHNLWVSVDLFEQLLKRNCHSIGMIKRHSRGTPKELETKKIQDGELIGFQDPNGVTVIKWQLLGEPNYGITTCHTLETVPIPKKSKFQVNSLSGEEPVQDNVPKFLRDISQSERIFDAHDKYSINTSPVNEHVKWYQRLACDAIVNTATINALVLYKKLNNDKSRMWSFRDKLFRELVDIKQLPNISSDEETEEPDLDE